MRRNRLSDADYKVLKNNRRYWNRDLPSPGRPKGSKNKVPALLKDAIIMAARIHGSDRKGTDELVGYLYMIARDYPKQFVSLLGRVLPYNITATVDAASQFQSKEELLLEMQRRGLPVKLLDPPAGAKDITLNVEVQSDAA